MIPEDVKELAVDVCAKRIIVKSEYLIKGITPEQILAEVIERVEVPVLKGAL
ncbi:hypothetical protein ES703_13173 [subsurface metagenome]